MTTIRDHGDVEHELQNSDSAKHVRTQDNSPSWEVDQNFNNPVNAAMKILLKNSGIAKTVISS